MKSLKPATLALALAAAVTGPLACQRSAEQPEQSQGKLGQEGETGGGETVAPTQVPSVAPETATGGGETVAPTQVPSVAPEGATSGTGMEATPGQSDTVAPTEVPADDSSKQEAPPADGMSLPGAGGPAEAPSGGAN